MKRFVVVVIVIFSIVFLLGCFKFKTISFTDKTNIDGGFKTDSSKNAVKNQSDDQGFIFNAGRINYTNGRITGTNSNKSNKDENFIGASYKSLVEFYNYINEIKAESDKSMEILEIPGYKKEDISGAIVKNRLILEKGRKVVIPEELFITSEGKYYADKLCNDYLESLLLSRLKLLENMSKDMNKKSEDIQREISTLKNAVIPNKEAALKFAGESMMEEEGYIWNNTLKIFEIKNDKE